MNIFKFLKAALIDQYVLGFGGGGGGGPTNSTTQTSNIPEYARPYVETMLGATQQQLFNTKTNDDGSTQITGVKPYVPYSSNPEDYVAGFSPMQQQAQQGAANLYDPTQYGAATGMAGMAGMGSLGAGRNYANQYMNGDIQRYMNPYIQQSLAPQLAEMERQYGITGAQEMSNATRSGAFGGSREALMAAENQRNKNMAMNQAIGQGYNNAFQQAQQAQQFGANLGLQGYGQALQSANALGQLGNQQLQNQQGILNLQNQMGTAQQQQQQNIINNAINNYAMAQQYPQQQLAFMNAQIRGLPLQSTTTQSYQAAPSMVSQLGGLGTTALAGYKLAGMAKGGEVEDEGDGLDALSVYNAMKGQ